MNARKKIKNHAQMITLMGVILAISVFMISSLAAEIANIDFVISADYSTLIFTEFNNIKDTFGLSLNYNLIDIKFDSDNQTYLFGDIDDIYLAFNQTRDEYFNVTFKHDILFDADLNRYWYSHNELIKENTTTFYKVEVALYLDDGTSNIVEDVVYSIACTPII